MMLEGKGHQMFQTLLDNETIISEHQKTPKQVLDAISYNYG